MRGGPNPEGGRTPLCPPHLPTYGLISGPTKKKIRVDLTEDNVYELPFEKKFEVFTKDQMERMIYLLKQEQLQK